MARIPRLLEVPIGFAHRGASAQAPGNTMEAFRLAVELGASGLESDVWVSDDGEPVLDHDGMVGGWLRRRPIATVPRARLPEHMTTLHELYAEVGAHLPVSLDIKDPDAMGPAIAAADAVDARELLWLCHPKPGGPGRVAGPVGRGEARRLLQAAGLPSGPGAGRRRAVRCGRRRGEPPPHEWTGGLTTLFHRFGLCALAWDVQLPRHLAEVLDMGIDGVFSDHVDRMMEAIAGWLQTIGALRTALAAAATRAHADRGQRPDPDEGAADDLVLVDGPEDAAVAGVGAVVTHHEHATLGDVERELDVAGGLRSARRRRCRAPRGCGR